MLWVRYVVQETLLYPMLCAVQNSVAHMHRQYKNKYWDNVVQRTRQCYTQAPVEC